MAIERQSSTLPPAQPSYILRGHTAQIHSVQFVRQNSRLLTGDAEGWVVFWKIETKRALAVWKAHDGAILGTAEWGRDKIVTHGRDNNLRIWQLRASDETALSTVLPAEPAKEERPKPWLLHTLPVNTLNFCAFSMCYMHDVGSKQRLVKANSTEGTTKIRSSTEPIMIAVPARDDKKIEVYQFPDEKLKCVVPRAQSTDTGMVMAVKLIHHLPSKSVLVLAGYEGGLTAVHKLPQNNSGSALGLSQLVYLSQPHSQPILSIDAWPDTGTFFTSSADAIIAAHRIPELRHDSHDEENSPPVEEPGVTLVNQSLSIHEHATNDVPLSTPPSTHVLRASDDVIEPPGINSESSEIAKETTSTSSAEPLSPFAKRTISNHQTNTIKPAGLSSLLSSAKPQSKAKVPPPPPPVVTIQPAYKTTHTKHAGQQSLRVRSDGRLLVTGGWDTRVRIYSTKTLKEVAVLKWHKEGVYAVAFSAILRPEDLVAQQQQQQQQDEDIQALIKRDTSLATLQRQREQQTQLKHWVAAGAKDGKISLWEVF